MTNVRAVLAVIAIVLTDQRAELNTQSFATDMFLVYHVPTPPRRARTPRTALNRFLCRIILHPPHMREEDREARSSLPLTSPPGQLMSAVLSPSAGPLSAST